MRDVVVLSGCFVTHRPAQTAAMNNSCCHETIYANAAYWREQRVWKTAAYQEILPLRTNNSEGDVIFADGVSEGHRATDVLAG